MYHTNKYFINIVFYNIDLVSLIVLTKCVVSVNEVKPRFFKAVSCMFQAVIYSTRMLESKKSLEKKNWKGVLVRF